MCSKQPSPSFLFSRKAIFSFFPEIKTKKQSFTFITVDKLGYDILQESRVISILMFLKKLFWRKFLNKSPAAYNQIKCMSLEIALKSSYQMFSK